MCTSISALLSFAATAQNHDDTDKAPPATRPELKSNGRNAADFAPPGWKVDQQAFGDLNGDGRPDLAFVLHGTNKALLVRSEFLQDEMVDTNPNLLGVALANADGTFTLAVQNGYLIPRWGPDRATPTFGDALSLTIRNGTLRVELAVGADPTFYTNVRLPLPAQPLRADRLQVVGDQCRDTEGEDV